MPQWIGFSSSTNTDIHDQSRLSKHDGRLNLHVHHTADKGILVKALTAGVKGHFRPNSHFSTDERNGRSETAAEDDGPWRTEPSFSAPTQVPRMNIVIMVIGSRGDIQPFIELGRVLKNQHGHRVRIATHPAFRQLVHDDCGLDFFDVGGDPSELMAYMIKNPGLIPSFRTLREGEIHRRRRAMSKMFRGFWRACVQPSSIDSNGNGDTPFVADAIISNPPVMCHIHCAERLGCPLHIMFTFPYTPTRSFPHPFANVRKSTFDESYTNFLSYPLVEMFTWQGLGDLINEFRVHSLGLDPVSILWAPGQLYRLRVPHTYMWSPGLISMPPDWGSEINIAGFVFLELATRFAPSKALIRFLDEGPAPIYIGFGSIVVDDPDHFTGMILEAVSRAGVRALINKGWGGIGGKTGDLPKNVMLLDNVPHDWLFPRCSAVVHHGGAGTTAIGLKCAKPTMIIPFFGDQPFWGSAVASAGAGARNCIPHKHMTADKLTLGIKECLKEDSQINAARIAESISQEGDGALNAVNSFHRFLPLSGPTSMRCMVFRDRAAVWTLGRSRLRLSAMAAELLVSAKQVKCDELRLWRTYAWNDYQGAGDPITGASSALLKLAAGISKGAAAVPISLSKDVSTFTIYERQKHRHDKKKRKQRETEGMSRPTSISGSSRKPSPCGISRSELVDGKPDNPVSPSDVQLNAMRDGFEADSITDDTKTRKFFHQDAALVDAGAIPEPSLHKHLSTILYDTTIAAAGPFDALTKFPMELFLGIANGFHNLPHLYGDDTVRRSMRITGVRSGIKAAAAELALQSWDATTGVITQPKHGYQVNGLVGAATGLGKGLGGLVSKGCAAVAGPVAFTMKGAHKELTKHKTPVSEMRAVRIAQGKSEVAELAIEEREAALQMVLEAWKRVKETPGESDATEHGILPLSGGPISERASITVGSWIKALRNGAMANGE